MGLTRFIGQRLAQFLTRPGRQGQRVATSPPERLAATLLPGDVLLVEGCTRISTAIKYLTQSSWSHAALYLGELAPASPGAAEPNVLLEADLKEGVRLVPLSLYSMQHTRICRPIGLSPEEIRRVANFALARLGHQYDLKHIIDLARYLLPTPPVPTRWRRRLIALGSGDPTRAICSSLIAQAFQAMPYPILPTVERVHLGDPTCRDCYTELMQIRDHTLFTPRDFDVSPYFQIIKPTIEIGFDPHNINWKPLEPAGAA